MPRQRNPNRDKAKEIYTQHKGNITNRQIAELLGENEKVVAVWKQRDKWNDVQQSYQSCTTKEDVKKDDIKHPEEKQTGVDGLSAKQRLFVAEYLKDANATQAAIRAGYSDKTAQEQSSRLLSNVKVGQAIENAMKEREKRTGVTADMVVEQLAKIAFADIRQVVTWDGPYITLKPSAQVDGTILAEVSENVSDSGVTRKVKLSDRMKALEILSKHTGITTDSHRRRLDESKDRREEEKLLLEKEKVALERAKHESEEDDGGDGLSSLADAIKQSNAMFGGDE